MTRGVGWTAFVLLAGVVGIGCDDSSTSPEDPVTVRVHFEHESSGTARGGAPLVFDQILYTNDAGNAYSVKVLRYIISDVTLHTADWSISYDMVHYRDARESFTRTARLEELPAATYEAISFTFGLDEEKNLDPSQGGLLPQTPLWEAMRWPATWGGGYHYMKLEGDLATDTTSVSYLTHAGKRQAQEDPVFGTDPEPFHHYFRVTLNTDDIEMEPGEQWDVTILMDVNAWYDTNPLGTYDLSDYPGGMMMNTDAQNLLETNGPSVFSLGAVVQTQTSN